MFSSSLHTATPPRPLRIVMGGLMAIGGLIGGAAVGVHGFHRALVMQGEPVELDWETLVRDGYGEHANIRLVGVDVVDPYLALAKEFEGLEFGELVDDPLIRKQMRHMGLGPAKVYPTGRNPADIDCVIKIAPGEFHLAEAIRQIEEQGSVTGMVSTYTPAEMADDLYALITGQEVNVGPKQNGERVFTLVPVDGTPDLSLARQWFLVCGFAMALGLVWCGSGGPGFWCCWYAPVPSILSLVGYPMRYGRGSWTTRMVYIAIGTVLMGYGFYVLVTLGRLGLADGNPLFHALGFISVFAGLGAVLAVPLQITMRALDASVEATPKKKPVRMSWEQACSLEPVEREIIYEDQPLVPAGSLPLMGEIKQKSDALAATGFSQATSLQWQREEGLAAASVQLGCHQMVIADLEYNNDSDLVQTVLISVLGNGLPILTVSANSAAESHRPTNHCLFRRAQVSEPAEMLAAHLQVVVEEAEKRDTIVVEIQEDETQDLVHLARRALAEIRGTLNGQNLSVGAQRYGRFHYPPRPVPERASAEMELVGQ